MTESINADRGARVSAWRGVAGSRWRWMVTLVVLLVIGLAGVLWPKPAPSDSSFSEVIESFAADVPTPLAVAESEPEPDAAPGPPLSAEPATAAVIASAAPVVAPRPAVAPPPPPPVVRVRIPVLAVDAPVLQMGFDAAGVMEVPQNPSTVAWYGFSAQPGSAGNAVMAGHVTWGGARAVFNQLGALRAGDLIEVRTAEGDLRYAVQRTYLVRPEEADVSAIVGPRDGPQTLTLITCGGSFDSSVRQYDQRVIVFATRV